MVLSLAHGMNNICVFCGELEIEGFSCTNVMAARILQWKIVEAFQVVPHHRGPLEKSATYLPYRTYLPTYIHTYIHTVIQLYSYIHIYTCIHVCIVLVLLMICNRNGITSVGR